MVSERENPDKKLPTSFVILSLSIKTAEAMSWFPKTKNGLMRVDALHFGEDDRNGCRNRLVVGLKSDSWDVSLRSCELGAAVTPVYRSLGKPESESIHWTFYIPVQNAPDIGEDVSELVAVPRLLLCVLCYGVNLLFALMQ